VNIKVIQSFTARSSIAGLVVLGASACVPVTPEQQAQPQATQVRYAAPAAPRYTQPAPQYGQPQPTQAAPANQQPTAAEIALEILQSDGGDGGGGGWGG
jgi:hypothetical protein